jgi:hypothetical protein
MKREYNFSKGKRGAVVRAPKGKTEYLLNILGMRTHRSAGLYCEQR